MLSATNPVAVFINDNAALIDLPVTLSIGLIGMYACMAISYNLGKYYKLYIPGCVTLSTFSFLFMVATFNDEGQLILKQNLGARGPSTAMIVGLLTVELYNFCKKRNITIRMPEGATRSCISILRVNSGYADCWGDFIVLRFIFL